MTTKQYTHGTLNMNEMKFRPDKFPGFPSRGNVQAFSMSRQLLRHCLDTCSYINKQDR